MSKKINLSGRCIGLTSDWNQKFQFYSKSLLLFKNYFFLIDFTKNCILKKNYYSLNKIFILNLKAITSKININIIISLYKFKLDFLDDLCFFLVNFWSHKQVNFISPKIKIFVVENFYFSNKFLNSLICYLVLRKKYTPKKVFNVLIRLLDLHLFSTILSTSKNGVLFKKLVGFKVQLKGRFENSKNSMSKKISFKIGKINSTDLNSCIIFYKYSFYSKLGLGNLKIWLCYKIIKDN